MAVAAELVVLFRGDTSDLKGKSSEAQGVISSVLGGLGKIGLAGMGLGAIKSGIEGIASAAGGLVSGNAQFERYNTQLGTLLGSADAAKDRLQELAAFGAATPFELPELVEAEKVLIGFGLQGERAMKLTGQSAEGLRTIVGDVAAGIGVPFQELAVTVGKFSTGATGEAIARMQELGIVTKEQLEEMGITFNKGGSLTSPVDEALTATISIMQDKFGGGMDALSRTFEGKMSTLSDTWAQIKRTLMAPLFDVAGVGLDGVLSVLGGVVPIAERVAAGFGLISQGAGLVRSMLGEGIGAALTPLRGMVDDVGAAFDRARERASYISDPIRSANAFLIELGMSLSGTPLAGVVQFIRGQFASWRPAMEDVLNLWNVFQARTGDLNLSPLEKLGELLRLAARGFGGDAIEGWAIRIRGAISTAQEVVGSFIEGFNLEPDMGFLDRLQNGFGNLSAAVFESFPSLSGFASVLETLTGAVSDFLGGFSGSDAPGILGMIADGLRAIGGENTPAVLVFLASAIDNVVAGASLLWETIQPWIPSFTTIITLVAGAVAGFASFSILTTVAGWVTTIIGVVTSLSAWWGTLSAAMAAATGASGVIGAVIAALGGPITVVAGLIAVLAVAWAKDWGGMREKVASVVGWISSNVVPIIQSAFGLVRQVMADLAAWWSQDGESVMGTVGTVASFIGTAFSNLFSIVSGIVSGGLALLRGDWQGFGQALGSIAGGAVSLIVNAFKGLFGLLRSTLSGAWEGIKSFLKGQADSAGKFTLDGLISGLKSGAGRVYTALKDLATGMIKGFTDNLKIFSPSRVFAELGEWITLGLALGIGRKEADAVDALSKVLAGMNTVISSLQDFGTKLVSFVVPSDEALRSAKGKFLQLLMIAQDFTKDISYLGAFMPVANTDEASAAQRGAIQIRLDQLAAQFSSIRELQGIKPEDLLTGGEASWASKLLDIIGKTASTWGSVAEALTKMATAKFPAPGDMQRVRESALSLVLWIQDLAREAAVNPVGLDDFAAGVKAAADALNAAASVKLSGIARLAADELDTARLNAVDIWGAAANLSAALRGLAREVQTEIIDGLSRFATGMKAARDSVVAGLVTTADLEGLVRLTAAGVDTMRLNAVDLWVMAAHLSAAFRGLAAEVQTEIVDGLKRFSEGMSAVLSLVKLAAVGEIEAQLRVDVGALQSVLAYLRDVLTPTVLTIATEWGLAAKAAEEQTARMKLFNDWIGAALSIVKASEVGEVEAGILVKVDIMEAILVWVRDRLAPLVQGIAEGWSLASKEAEMATARMKEFNDWVGAALSIVKASEVGEVEAGILVKVDIMTAILEWVRDRLAPLIQSIAEAWLLTNEAGKLATDRMKAFGDWVSAALSVVKTTQVGEVEAGILVNVTIMEAILVWLRDHLAPLVQRVAEGWSLSNDAGKAVTERMKAFNDWVSGALSLVKLTEIGTIKANMLVNVAILEAILVYLRDQFVPMIWDIVDDWTLGTDAAKAMTARMKLFGDWVRASVGIFADVADGLQTIASAGVLPDLTSQIQSLKGGIQAAFAVVGEIATTISTEEAKARAELASAAATVVSSLGDIGSGLTDIMGLVESKLFGAGPTRTDLGFMQRARGRRADFMASVLKDTITRSVRAVQDALSGLDIEPDDPKVKAIEQLGNAFSSLAEALTDLANAKVPNARQLASIMAATSAIAVATAVPPAGAAAGGGGGSAAAAGGQPVVNLTYNQYGDRVVQGSTSELDELIKLALGGRP